MSLKIKTNHIDKIATLEVYGFIDASSAPAFAESIKHVCSSYNAESIIIDCSYLERINSDGLTVLANLVDKNKKIRISMHNTAAEITELLKLCGFNYFIDISHSPQKINLE